MLRPPGRFEDVRHETLSSGGTCLEPRPREKQREMALKRQQGSQAAEKNSIINTTSKKISYSISMKFDYISFKQLRFFGRIT